MKQPTHHEAFVNTTDCIRDIPALPKRPDQGHKGNFGTVIVIGGNALMPGAPALCAGAALRAGAGLVKIAAAPSAGVLPWPLLIEPGATGLWLPETMSEASLNGTLDQTDPQQKAILAVGPGMGQGESLTQCVLWLMRQPRPMVLDADGLNALAILGQERPKPGCALVMTPHPGEYARLAVPLRLPVQPQTNDERIAAAKALAQAHAAIVVLKGHRSIVTDGRHVYVNPTGNPALATAGSGDVLTGLIAGLMAQGMSPFHAAVLGVYLHGLAGDLWARRHGPVGLTATALLQLLAETLTQHARA